MHGTWKSGERSLMAQLCFVIAPKKKIIVRVLYNLIQGIIAVKRKKMEIYAGMYN
jgi:hypothetical protein